MSRFRFLAALLLPLSAVSAWGQSYAIQPVSLSTYNDPNGGFMFGVRMIGQAKVRFLGVGNIPSIRDIGDLAGERYRGYDDGYVGPDLRSTTGGENLPDDYKTNNWSYRYAEQVLPDQSGIAFHSYAALNNGSVLDVDSGETPTIDMEIAQRFGRFGGRIAGGASRWTWGGMLGVGFGTVNAKTRGEINATLHTLTDVYSLDGFAPPPAPYTAPSSQSVTRVDENGNVITDTLDPTTYLANVPYSRTETLTPDGAEVEGFWQVKGAYFTVRAGPWVRYNLNQRFSVRASAGATFSYLGLEMRYDEWMNREDTTATIRTSGASEPDKYSLTGVFASLDGEVWLTRNTGFFLSLTYDRMAHKAELSPDLLDPVFERRHRAEVSLDSGLGARMGLTLRF